MNTQTFESSVCKFKDGVKIVKVDKNVLVQVPYHSKFSEMLVVDNIDGLLLNTIKVYGINKKKRPIQESVDFCIRNIIGKMAIYPTGGWYDEFCMIAQRVVRANVVEIEASDYWDKTESESGDFTFIMNTDKG